MKLFPILHHFLALLFITSLHGEPISVELSGGSVINGEIISWNGEEVEIKAEFGTMKLKKDSLSSKTLEKLDLQSGDPKKLAARIVELEATVESLRRDNAALRQQLSQPSSQSSGIQSSGVTSQTEKTSKGSSGLSYSKTSTGKRHNSNCRYYKSGSPCGPSDGVACKICGG